MKKYLIISLIVLIFSSCTTLVFETPVPKNTKSLTEFPKDLIGRYFDGEKDTLIISKTNFVYGRKDSSFIYINKDLKEGLAELKEFNNEYILNIKSDKADVWVVIPFVKEKDKITAYFANLDAIKEKLSIEQDTVTIDSVVTMINKITSVKTIKKENSQEEDYMINPNNKEFKQLLDEGYFSKLLEFKKIK